MHLFIHLSITAVEAHPVLPTALK